MERAVSANSVIGLTLLETPGKLVIAPEHSYIALSEL
jgi:hypothetical protein